MNYDIVIREVKGYGWLGIIQDEDGNQVYRTGNYQKTPQDALEKSLTMMPQVSSEDEELRRGRIHRM